MPIGTLVTGRPIAYDGGDDLASTQITDDGIAAANKDGATGTQPGRP